MNYSWTPARYSRHESGESNASNSIEYTIFGSYFGRLINEKWTHISHDIGTMLEIFLTERKIMVFLYKTTADRDVSGKSEGEKKWEVLEDIDLYECEIRIVRKKRTIAFKCQKKGEKVNVTKRFQVLFQEEKDAQAFKDKFLQIVGKVHSSKIDEQIKMGFLEKLKVIRKDDKE